MLYYAITIHEKDVMNLKASKGVYMEAEEEEKEKGMIYNYTLKNKISYLKKCDSK